jgi:ubiquinone/menaquinone biosynthesis C-methylase UbiE
VALFVFAGLGVAATALALVSWREHDRLWRPMTIYGAFFFANAGSFFYTTRRGKFRVWDAVLDELRLRGNERVLDMGCGRGAVLIAVAKRLTSGLATGIDLWSTSDQSGNAREVTLRNSELEGVRDHIDVETGDMRALPFADASFDVVVSSLAIHNIRSHTARAQAVAEAWRVLRPGGRLRIADIRVSRHYAAKLRELGAAEVTRRRLGWRFWYGNPIAGTTLVSASKPERV